MFMMAFNTHVTFLLHKHCPCCQGSHPSPQHHGPVSVYSSLLSFLPPTQFLLSPESQSYLTTLSTSVFITAIILYLDTNGLLMSLCCQAVCSEDSLKWVTFAHGCMDSMSRALEQMATWGLQVAWEVVFDLFILYVLGVQSVRYSTHVEVRG
jgi:hypothetical protein